MTRKTKLIFPSHKDWRRTNPIPSILEDWYGKEEGASETIAHLPDAVSIQDAIHGVLSGSNSNDSKLFNAIRDEWSNIVGKDISSIASPKYLKDGVLQICVSNSSWMMELRSEGKKIILAKIREVYGKDSIRDINFVLSG